MDFEKTIYRLRRNGLGRKVLKVLLTGCLVLVVLIVILIVFAIVLAVKYHTQIYEGFNNAINFIFGDSTINVVRGWIQQIVDIFIKNLFQ